MAVPGHHHAVAATGDSIPTDAAPPDTEITAIFPLPELVQHIKAKQTGVMEATLRGQKVVIAYDEVSPFGWSVVAVADARALLKNTDEDLPAL